MASIIFSHSKTREKDYLKQLLKEKEWFEREKFLAFLPESKADIEKEVSSDDKTLNRKIVQLQDKWKKVETYYFQIIKEFHHKKLLMRYICHVSLFGPEGKYCRPNLLFVRLRTKSDEKRVIETIGHELLHLLFADFFESKKLNYAEREGMVDALILESKLTTIFPRYNKQSIGKVRRKLLESIIV